jgi:hypothetical protein
VFHGREQCRPGAILLPVRGQYRDLGAGGSPATSQIALVYQSASPAMSPEIAAQLRLLRHMEHRRKGGNR